jgi:hypothetical protein
MKLALTILLLTTAFAQRPTRRGPPTSPDKVTAFAAGLYRSSAIFHGALIFDGSVFFPGIGVDFYEKLVVRGPNIEYYKRNGRDRTSIGIRPFNDDPFGIKLSGSQEPFRQNERRAFELYFNWRKQWKRFTYRFFISHEMFHDNWNYLYQTLTIKALPFTRIGYGHGIGDKRHNQFVYGPNSRSGVAHHDFLVNVFIPFVPWQGAIIVNYTQPLIYHEENRAGSFVSTSDRPKVFQAIISYYF